MIDVNLIGAPAFAAEARGEDFVYVAANRRLIAVAGDIVGRSPTDVVSPEAAAAVLSRYRHCANTRQPIESEMRYSLPGGDVCWHITITPILGADGSVSSLFGVATDVTQARRAERERREAEVRMALAMDALDGGFWHLDLATGEVEVTAKLAASVAGRVETRMGWATYIAGVHPDDRGAIDLAPLLRGEVEIGTAEYRAVGASGATRWFRSRRRLVRDAAGRPCGIIGVVVDITEARRLREAYERQAGTDPLTGLANRRAFEASAGGLLAPAAAGRRRFGLVLLDVDRFKAVNDQHGHAVGDAILRALGDRLRGLVRPEDVVARLGGDEFAILVADVRDGALSRLAQRIVLAGGQPVDTPVGPVSVGLSVGLATAAGGDRGIGDLANRADRALYDVKLSGRGDWKEVA